MSKCRLWNLPSPDSGLVLTLIVMMAGGSLATGQAPVTGVPASPLPGTQPLTMTGDIADALVAGVDRFLLRRSSIDRRAGQALEARLQLGRSLQRLGRAQPQAAGTYPGGARPAGAVRRPAARGHIASPTCWPAASYEVFAVRWPAFGDVTRRGLCCSSRRRQASPDVIVIPDADQSPEQLVGLPPASPRNPSSPAGWQRAAAG